MQPAMRDAMSRKHPRQATTTQPGCGVHKRQPGCGVHKHRPVQVPPAAEHRPHHAAAAGGEHVGDLLRNGLRCDMTGSVVKRIMWLIATLSHVGTPSVRRV
ncbi:hypothetical protein HaLaN_23416, partial [Haematococcus lacustris]